jgi:hypothetical protein
MWTGGPLGDGGLVERCKDLIDRPGLALARSFSLVSPLPIAARTISRSYSCRSLPLIVRRPGRSVWLGSLSMVQQVILAQNTNPPWGSKPCIRRTAMQDRFVLLAAVFVFFGVMYSRHPDAIWVEIVILQRDQSATGKSTLILE